jgi:hypothetical protein
MIVSPPEVLDNSSKHGVLPAKTRTEAIHMGGVHQQQ